MVALIAHAWTYKRRRPLLEPATGVRLPDSAHERPMIAVVGTGSMGMRHLQALAAQDDCTVVAVPCRHSRLASLSEAGYTTAASVGAAALRGARFCIIASDTGRHVEDGTEALRHGLHVLVEKPIAPTADQATTLVRAATAAGRRLYVGCALRFSESLNVFRARLSEIGPVHDVRIEAQSYLPAWRPGRELRQCYSARAEEGGVLRDLIHEIDYAGWLFGWPASIWARLRNHDQLGIDAEEAADLVWQAPSGPTVSIRLDYLSQPPRRRMRASGVNGTLEWDGIGGCVTRNFPNGQVDTARSSETRDEMVVAQAIAFRAACEGSADERLATASDGLRALAVCDAAREASISGREQHTRSFSE